MNDFTRHLLPGERVLWEGRPSNGLILRPIEILLIPFSLLWGGFAVFWNVMVWTGGPYGAPLAFKLFGLPFLVAALYITIGRFLADMWQRKRLRYAVTDRRVLILKLRGGTSVKSLDISRGCWQVVLVYLRYHDRLRHVHELLVHLFLGISFWKLKLRLGST